MSARGQRLGLFATANWVHIPFEEAKMRRQFGAIYNNIVARYGTGSDYQLLRCMSLRLAQSGHFATRFQCPLLGVKRTLRKLGPTAVRYTDYLR